MSFKPRLRPIILVEQEHLSLFRQTGQERQCLLLASSITFEAFDRKTGIRYTRQNHFVDGGDKGDEYNFSAPDADTSFSPNRVKLKEACYVSLFFTYYRGIAA